VEFVNLPTWTYIEFRSNSGEDHLGALSVGANIAEDLLPGINTVTPRARYRSFYSWVVVDFLERSKDKSRSAFKQHLRRREMAYILSHLSILKPGEYITGVIGITKGQEIFDSGQDPLNVDQVYVSNEYGGYAIYRGSMQTMHLIKDSDNPSLADSILPKGKELAEAFKRTIINTLYYREYLDKDLIPRTALKEYGEVAGLEQTIGHEDHKVLLEAFLRPDLPEKRLEVQRRESIAYFLEVIAEKPNNKWNTDEAWRRLLLNSRFYDGTHFTVSPEFSYAQQGWMVYQVRQYFAYALETIFCHVINRLHLKSSSLEELLDPILISVNVEIKGRNYPFNSEFSLEEMIETLPTIVLEDLFAFIKGTSIDELDVSAHVVVPTFMLIEVYRWVKNLRRDMYSWKYARAGGVDHLSLEKFIRDVESLIEKKAKVKDFCNMIISHYLVRQHHRVALEKLMGYKLETFRILDNEQLQRNSIFNMN